MSTTADRILDAARERGWTDDTLVTILLDAIDGLDDASADAVLIHVQQVIDDERDTEDGR